MAAGSAPVTVKGIASAVGTVVVLLWLIGGGIGPCIRSCGGPLSSPLRLSIAVREGWLVSHDVTLTNTTGEDLTEVNLSLRIVGEDGSPVVDRYWARWALGSTQAISVPVSTVKNLQRVELTGTADQGPIDQTFELKQ